MTLKIKQDHARFKAIVRGRIKQNLRRFIQKGEMLGKRGKELITIPVPTIDIPRFRFGPKQQGGVGQGEGEVGTILGPADEQGQEGQGKAGDAPGDHLLEVDVSLDELAEILGEELELPRIEPKGSDRIVTEKTRYVGGNTTAPQPLRHLRRSGWQPLLPVFRHDIRPVHNRKTRWPPIELCPR